MFNLCLLGLHRSKALLFQPIAAAAQPVKSASTPVATAQLEGSGLTATAILLRTPILVQLFGPVGDHQEVIILPTIAFVHSIAVLMGRLLNLIRLARVADAVVYGAAVEAILQVAPAHNRRVLVTRGRALEVVIGLIQLAQPPRGAQPGHVLGLIVGDGGLAIRRDLRRAIVVALGLLLVAQRAV